MEYNKLEKMFDKQIALQHKLNTFPIPWDERYIKDMVLASMVELTEILNETPWKPWKLNQELGIEEYKEEIADLLHFVINLCIVGQITPADLFDTYMTKNKVNIKRHQEGY